MESSKAKMRVDQRNQSVRDREKSRDEPILSNAFDELATVLSGIEPDDTTAKKGERNQ
jgi:hypothetical protein